eukprot:590519_1
MNPARSKIIVVPENALLVTHERFRKLGRIWVWVGLVVNGDYVKNEYPYLVKYLSDFTEAITQLKVTKDIAQGSFDCKPPNDVVDFSESTFEFKPDGKTIKPITVDLRHCPTQHAQKDGVELTWFQLPNNDEGNHPSNCKVPTGTERYPVIGQSHLLESSPIRLYYPAVIGRRDGRNPEHAVANWIDPYAWYRVFY